MASPLLDHVMTLGEYSKSELCPQADRAIVQMFAESSDVATAFPVIGISSAVYYGFRQSGLPANMAFRAVNAASTSGAGTITPFQESLFAIDHDINVDRFLVDNIGTRRRAIEEKGGVTRLGELWLDTFLKGDNGVTPTTFNGLQKRSAQYGRTIDNAAGVSGGAPLSLYQLDLALHNTSKPTHIIAPWALMPRFTQAARNTSLTGYVMQTWDGIGTPKTTYKGLPVLFGYQKDLHPPILPFTETAAGGGGAVTSSLYAVSFGEEGLVGIQRAPISVRDVGLLQDSITYTTHFSWDVGLVDNGLFCFTRLSGITNAAFVL